MLNESVIGTHFRGYWSMIITEIDVIIAVINNFVGKDNVFFPLGYIFAYVCSMQMHKEAYAV